MPYSLREIIKEAKRKACQHSVEENNVLLLLADAMCCNHLELLSKHDFITSEQHGVFEKNLARLLAYEPLQYILGEAWFYGLRFKIDPSVLIPRPETEGLVKLVLDNLKDRSVVLDIGCGSGVIAVSLKHLFPSLVIHACDISPSAIKVAKQNDLDHNCDVEFHLCDLFPDINIKFDAIVSNPPYISEVEYDRLPPWIRDHEPKLALLAEEDGLIYYRKILELASQYLHPGGSVYFEIGAGQGEGIVQLAHELGWKHYRLGKDLNGYDRYLHIFRSN